jgi:RimJ/RimL family protein N-acetyltransferase
MTANPFKFKKPLSLLDVRIESERLLLQPISSRYVQVVYEEFTPQITLYMHPSSPSEIAETEYFINSAEKALREGRDLQCVILRRSDNEFLGVCGLHAGYDEMTPELGIWLKRSAHGQGFGREAITMLKNWADQNITYSYLVYPVDRNNTPSRKIPEQLGGYVIGEKKAPNQSGRILDQIIFRIDYKASIPGK